MRKWIYNPKFVKLNKVQRDILIEKSNTIVQLSQRLKKRISIKTGRISSHDAKGKKCTTDWHLHIGR